MGLVLPSTACNEATQDLSELHHTSPANGSQGSRKDGYLAGIVLLLMSAGRDFHIMSTAPRSRRSCFDSPQG